MNTGYLTWDDLAEFYAKKTGGRARIQPMEQIYDWAVKQPEIVETNDGLKFKAAMKESGMKI